MSCPFMSRAAGDAAAPPAGKCPMAGHTSSAPQQHDPSPAPAAVCPLGFGSSRGPKLSTLHCPVCKGLIHDAHSSAGCKHTFCHACISRARDCPVCGMDVEGMEPNQEISGLVDTFLDTHSKSPELVAAQTDLGPLPDNSPASFFMAQGLKSLAGGNVHAALHRLSRCREALLEAAAAPGAHRSNSLLGTDAAAVHLTGTFGAGATAAAGSLGGNSSSLFRADSGQVDVADSLAGISSMQIDHQQQHVQQQRAARLSHYTHEDAAGRGSKPSLAAAAAAACQMAAVCGSLGDCYQRMGNASQAEQLYAESISSVEPFSESDAEAAHTMSVSLNKVGDMRYMQQQLEAAKELYRQALQLRQLCCGPLTGGQAGPEKQLELASSLIKVAGVCRALVEHEEAEQLLRRAQGVCFEVKLQDGLPPHVSRKLQLLLDVLHAQGSAAAC